MSTRLTLPLAPALVGWMIFLLATPAGAAPP
jgi:hypothetical protein